MPGRKWYGIAAGIFLLGLAVCAAFTVLRLRSLGDHLPQLVVPGTSEFHLAERGGYTIFHETGSVIDGRYYGPADVSGLSVEVVSAATGQPVPLESPTTNTTYSLGGRSGAAVLTFDIVEPGVYRVTGRYDDRRTGPTTVLAVGHGFTRKLMLTIGGAIGIAFGSFAVAAAIAIVTFFRRRRVRQRAATTVAAGAHPPAAAPHALAALALLVALAALAPDAQAQLTRTPRVGAGLPQQNPPAGPALPAQGQTAGLNKHADLVVSSPKLDPTGHVTYTVVNQGGVATASPFVADVYVDGDRKDTIKHDPLAGNGQQPVKTAVRFTGCATGTIRIVVDPQQTVGEFSETNNERSATATPPCPDLVVTAIKKNWEDMNTRYRAHVTVQNVGNAAAPESKAAAVATTGDPTSFPDGPWAYLPPLAPGAKTSFNAGGKTLGTATLNVHVILDHGNAIPESNEDNNEVRKAL